MPVIPVRRWLAENNCWKITALCFPLPRRKTTITHCACLKYKVIINNNNNNEMIMMIITTVQSTQRLHTPCNVACPFVHDCSIL